MINWQENSRVFNMSNYCTIYIIRHGETDENLNHIIQGQYNSILNTTGKQQAKNAAEKLKDIHFDHIFSSDLARTKETAEAIAIERNLAIQTTNVLRERRWGRLEGKSTKLIHEIEKLKATLSKEDKLKYKPHPEIESDEEITSRMMTFLREVAVGYPGKTILVVSHGGLIRALLNNLGKEAAHGAASNTAYIILESDGVDFFIKSMYGIKDL